MTRVAWVVALSLAAPTLARADDKPTVAVLGVMARESELAKAADAMTAELRVRAGAKASNYKVKGTLKQIETSILTAECSSIETSCAVKLGTTLATEYAIAGELERRGTHQILLLTLVDVQTKQRLRSVRETGATKVEPKKLLRAAYTRLINGEVGELSIVASAPRGEILLDGQVVGALFEGHATIGGLVNGTHQLSIRAKGFRPLDIDVKIEFATTQHILLEPE